jgi:prepilin-type N-terminal cleavage/methylation domain-containing protein
MKQNTNHSRRNLPGLWTSPRRGFTLIELLIVIAIIGVLAAFTLRVAGSLMLNARRAATQSTLMKIDGLLKTRATAFDRFYDEQMRTDATKRQLVGGVDLWMRSLSTGTGPNQRPAYITTTTNFLLLAGASPAVGAIPPDGYKPKSRQFQRALVLARKSLFRRFFPQSWGEVSGWGLATEVGYTIPTSFTGKCESSEVLYFMLTKSTLPGFEAIGADAFSTSEVADTDGNGALEFIDSWGEPIRFYRWPTRAVRPTGPDGAYDATSTRLLLGGSPTATTFRRDSDDALMRIPDSPTWRVLPAGTVFSADDFERMYHTPSTGSLPLVVSSGPDLLLGLVEPANPQSNPTDPDILLGRLATPLSGQGDSLNDNLTNLNSQAGANR